jgi:acyl-coenzyme A thioesterase PaaI-like protein
MDHTVALCRGCQASGRRCRFGADTLIAQSENEASLFLVCPADFQGGPNVAHGGWTTAVFDDALGRFLTHKGLSTVTATLTVDFLMPVPVERPLTVDLRIDKREGRRISMTGTLKMDGDPRPRATARGTWVERRPDHFERHQAQLSSLCPSTDG